MRIEGENRLEWRKLTWMKETNASMQVSSESVLRKGVLIIRKNFVRKTLNN